MLSMFDTRQCITDLVAGGVPLSQAETLVEVCLGVLQDCQREPQPDHAMLRLETEVYALHTTARHMQRVLDRLNPTEATP